ncbi:hypothetical protein [Arthrobacter sp. GMC3]|uniref:hypothetical protein n=1 Tax=Arthrobacter sp. GMC3 TaxID=2058894 RepID=UPI000CE554EB|nr:hypothetical protein [Arthrobacter sp. GMC3]
MDFELRTIAGCPHETSAGELFARAVALETDGQTVPALRQVNSDAEALELGFHGSPTFTANGEDLFPSNTEPAVSCRVYATPDGLAGQPTLETLRAAIQTVLAKR